MKNIFTTLAFFAMAMMISVSAYSQSGGRSYVGGRFMLELDGAKQGVIAPIDDQGNATFDNVKPGNHTVALLVPAIQKVRESATRSADKGHEKWIEIQSWSWGVSNPSSLSTGGSKREASTPSISEITVTKTMDKSTPKLAEHVCKGKVSKIDAFTIKQNGKDYHRIELENILVSSFQTSGGGSGNDRPMESLSLNFTKIQWDIKENKK